MTVSHEKQKDNPAMHKDQPKFTDFVCVPEMVLSDGPASSSCSKALLITVMSLFYSPQKCND